MDRYIETLLARKQSVVRSLQKSTAEKLRLEEEFEEVGMEITNALHFIKRGKV